MEPVRIAPGPTPALEGSVRSVTATRILRAPSENLSVSFNWWVSNSVAELDHGPQHKAHLHDFSSGRLGTPLGDVGKYFQLSNHEFDYDQIYTATIPPQDTLWHHLRDQELAAEIADGYDTRYLLSCGAFTHVEPERRYR